MKLFRKLEDWLLRLWIPVVMPPEDSTKKPVRFTARAISLFRWTHKPAELLCDKCDERATVRTQIQIGIPARDMETWTCEDHARDWKDFL